VVKLIWNGLRSQRLQIDHSLFTVIHSGSKGEKQESALSTNSCSIGGHVEGTFHA